jgi:hypothetical protein
MTFKKYELPDEYKMKRSAKILFTIIAVIWALLLILITVVLTIETHDIIVPFCSVILPFVLLALVFVVIEKDEKKAFVEIVGDKITVVDYFFGIKQQKVFSVKNIVKAEITHGGYSWPGTYGLTYLAFRGEKNKYLFSLICTPQAKSYFEQYFEIENAY